MRRRDTIIIAVLVNAALLMILFATATRPNKTETKGICPDQLVQNSSPPPLSQEELINQFITAVPYLPEVADEEIVTTEGSTPPVALHPNESVESARESTHPPSQSGHFVEVTVKKGDFLEKIAKANHCSVSAIQRANQLTSTQLKIGQVLKIPLAQDTSEHALATTVAPPKTLVAENTYIVKEGDNPWLIASRNHMKVEELLRLNGLDEQKARRLRPGDRLKIR